MIDIGDPAYQRDLVARDAHRALSAAGDTLGSSARAYGAEHPVTILSLMANRISGHLARDTADLNRPIQGTGDTRPGPIDVREETKCLTAMLAALDAGGPDHDDTVALHHARHPSMPWAAPAESGRDGSPRYTTSRDDAHRLVPHGWAILATCAVRTYPERRFACVGYGPDGQTVTGVGQTEALAVTIAATLMRDGRPPQPQADEFTRTRRLRDVTAP